MFLIQKHLFVNLCFGFASEDHQSVEGEGFHFVFARIDVNWSNLSEVVFQNAAESLVVSHAACDIDGIDIHAECRSSQTADFLGHLICHGAIDFLPFLVAGSHFFLDGESVVGAEISYETAFGSNHLLELGFGILARASDFDQFAGVDATVQFFEEAARRNGDFAVVHHGLFWKGQEWTRFDKYNKRIAKALLASDMNLFAMHLPLDAHPEVGNNAILCKLIGAEKYAPFGLCKGNPVGCVGKFAEPISIDELKKRIEEKVGKISTHLDFGKKMIQLEEL